MRVIIAGSRSFDCQAQDHIWPSLASCGACRKLYDLVDTVVRASGFEVTLVISGGARGVDKMGEIWAKKNGLPCITRGADWSLHGRAAGPIRNEEMITKDRADAVVVVWDGSSRGSQNMADLARRYNLPLYVHDASQTKRRAKKV